MDNFTRFSLRLQMGTGTSQMPMRPRRVKWKTGYFFRAKFGKQNTMSLVIAPYNPQAEISACIRELKSGAKVTTFMDKKAFALAHPDLKEKGSSALNKAHYEYKREVMAAQNGALGAALANGSLLVKSVRANPNGKTFGVQLVKRDAVKAPAESEGRRKPMTDAELLAELTKRGLAAPQLATV